MSKTTQLNISVLSKEDRPKFPRVFFTVFLQPANSKHFKIGSGLLRTNERQPLILVKNVSGHISMTVRVFGTNSDMEFGTAVRISDEPRYYFSPTENHNNNICIQWGKDGLKVVTKSSSGIFHELKGEVLEKDSGADPRWPTASADCCNGR